MNTWACCMCMKDLAYWEEMANLHIRCHSRRNIYNTVPHELQVSIRSVRWVPPSFCSRCMGESGHHQLQHGPLILTRAGMSKILDPGDEDWNAYHSRIQVQQQGIYINTKYHSKENIFRTRNTKDKTRKVQMDYTKLLLMRKSFFNIS